MNPGKEDEAAVPPPTTWADFRKLRKACMNDSLLPNQQPRFDEPVRLCLDPSDDSAEGALNNLLLVRAMYHPIDQGYINAAATHEDLDDMCVCVGHLLRMASGFACHSDPKSVVAMCACLSFAQTALGVLFTALCEDKIKYNKITHFASPGWLQALKSARAAFTQSVEMIDRLAQAGWDSMYL